MRTPWNNQEVKAFYDRLDVFHQSFWTCYFAVINYKSVSLGQCNYTIIFDVMKLFGFNRPESILEEWREWIDEHDCKFNESTRKYLTALMRCQLPINKCPPDWELSKYKGIKNYEEKRIA